jgi:hypothetical protein
MSSVEGSFRILEELDRAGVEYIVVGGLAAVLLGAPVVTADVDIVHRRSPDNVGRLLAVLTALDAHVRSDLAGRTLVPSEGHLTGHGHINLMTRFGPLDVLCEIGDGLGYDELTGDVEHVAVRSLDLKVLSLPKLIEVKTAAGRPKDRLTIPVLIATHQKRTRG